MSEKARLKKGKQILEIAREKIGLNLSNQVVDSFKLLINREAEIGGIRMLSQKEVNVMLPSKIITVESVEKPFKSKTTSVWNGGKYKKINESEIMGRRFVRDLTKPKPLNKKQEELMKNGLGKEQFEQMRKAKASQLKRDPRADFEDSLWNDVFPLILVHPFLREVIFSFIGNTKSDGRVAQVIDATTKSGRSIRLFFDVETKYLLLMVVRWQSWDGDYRKRLYFSDRKKIDGIVIPTKIKSEHTYIPTGKKPRISYAYIDIMEFALNPKFTEKMFKVD